MQRFGQVNNPLWYKHDNDDDENDNYREKDDNKKKINENKILDIALEYLNR